MTMHNQWSPQCHREPGSPVGFYGLQDGHMWCGLGAQLGQGPGDIRCIRFFFFATIQSQTRNCLFLLQQYCKDCIRVSWKKWLSICDLRCVPLTCRKLESWVRLLLALCTGD